MRRAHTLKRKESDFLQEGNGRARPVLSTPISPSPRAGDIPLSPAQERLWFLNQLEPHAVGYTIQGALLIQDKLDLPTLEQAFNELVGRHESLRTTVTAVNGEPIQVVHAELALDLVLVDLRGAPGDDRVDRIRALAAKEARCPFDLARGPLWRALILELQEAEFALILTMHPIISDERSMGVFVRELMTLYQAFLAGHPSPLAPLPIQYADFVLWQRRWLQGEELEQQLAYWRQQLAGAPPALALPTDRPRPPVQADAGVAYDFALPRRLSQQLHALSQREGVTLFVTLLAAFKLLLHRYTGQSNIVVGTPGDNRQRAGVEGLIGCLANTLVLHTRLAEKASFRQLLQQVQDVTLGALAHQELPFAKLVEAVQPERNLSLHPLFQVMFVLHNRDVIQADLPELAVTPLALDNPVTRFDLALFLAETETGLRGRLEYNAGLFTEATIARLVNHLQVLLAGVVADPDQALAGVPLLTAAEQEQVLVSWNRYEPGGKRSLAWTDADTIHAFVERQVARTPADVALIWEDTSFTYAAVNKSADQLAHHLRASGVGPETFVGVYLERTPALVVSLLAILKAGGAYVPLDPAYPAERLAFILADTRAPVLLTQRHLFPARTTAAPGSRGQNQTVVYLDEIGRMETVVDSDHTGPPLPAFPLSQENPAPLAAAANLAYVIYTSGSTGHPKGVAITHQNALALLSWAHDVYTAADLAGVLAATSICFDLSVFELFLPLIRGGTIILARDALHLPELPAQAQVSLVNTVPSVMAELVQVGQLPASLRTVNLAGEPLQLALARQVYAHPQVACLYNLYGPTEDTTYSTWTLLDRDDPRTPSIGRPIAGTQAYILDRRLEPTPIGVAGELYLGGLGVSRGYLHRPALTAERYIPNPFNRPVTGTPDPTALRLYRTGDLARFRPDGRIEFLGRLDHQVKIRGFRIELGEVEAVLSQHPAVAEAVVVARPDRRGENQLVGYVVPAQPQPRAPNPAPYARSRKADTDALRRHLQNHLPDYMIPATLVVLPALPQTPNGKVDRKALLQHDLKQRAATDYVPPRNPLEERLAAIWQDVLTVDRVGIHDSFFALGGDSLLAVSLMGRVQKDLGQHLPLIALFEDPTIEHLAQCIGHQSVAPSSWSPLVVTQPNGARQPFFAMSGTGIALCNFRQLAQALGPEQPLYALQAPGIDGRHPPFDNVPTLAEHYLEAILTIQSQGPYYLGGHSFGGLVAYEVAQLLQRQGEKVDLLAIMDMVAPVYDPGALPLDNEFQSLRETIRRLEHQYNRPLPITADMLAALGQQERLHYCLYQLQAAEILPADADLSTIINLFAYERAVGRALALYPSQAQRYAGPAVLFKAQQLAGQNFPIWGSALYRDTYLGWNQLVDGPITVHAVAGDHFSMVQQPHLPLLANHLRTHLNL